MVDPLLPCQTQLISPYLSRITAVAIFLVSEQTLRKHIIVLLSPSIESISVRFLDAPSHLYKRSCPSVCPCVRMSVRMSVSRKAKLPKTSISACVTHLIAHRGLFNCFSFLRLSFPPLIPSQLLIVMFEVHCYQAPFCYSYPPMVPSSAELPIFVLSFTFHPLTIASPTKIRPICLPIALILPHTSLCSAQRPSPPRV